MTKKKGRHKYAKFGEPDAAPRGSDRPKQLDAKMFATEKQHLPARRALLLDVGATEDVQRIAKMLAKYNRDDRRDILTHAMYLSGKVAAMRAPGAPGTREKTAAAAAASSAPAAVAAAAEAVAEASPAAEGVPASASADNAEDDSAEPRAKRARLDFHRSSSSTAASSAAAAASSSVSAPPRLEMIVLDDSEEPVASSPIDLPALLKRAARVPPAQALHATLDRLDGEISTCEKELVKWRKLIKQLGQYEASKRSSGEHSAVYTELRENIAAHEQQLEIHHDERERIIQELKATVNEYKAKVREHKYEYRAEKKLSKAEKRERRREKKAAAEESAAQWIDRESITSLLQRAEDNPLVTKHHRKPLKRICEKIHAEMQQAKALQEQHDLLLAQLAAAPPAAATTATDALTAAPAAATSADPDDDDMPALIADYPSSSLDSTHLAAQSRQPIGTAAELEDVRVRLHESRQRVEEMLRKRDGLIQKIEKLIAEHAEAPVEDATEMDQLNQVADAGQAAGEDESVPMDVAADDQPSAEPEEEQEDASIHRSAHSKRKRKRANRIADDSDDSDCELLPHGPTPAAAASSSAQVKYEPGVYPSAPE